MTDRKRDPLPHWYQFGDARDIPTLVPLRTGALVLLAATKHLAHTHDFAKYDPTRLAFVCRCGEASDDAENQAHGRVKRE